MRSLVPTIDARLVFLDSLGLLALAAINIVGIRESATVTLSLTDTPMKPVIETG